MTRPIRWSARQLTGDIKLTLQVTHVIVQLDETSRVSAVVTEVVVKDAVDRDLDGSLVGRLAHPVDGDACLRTVEHVAGRRQRVADERPLTGQNHVLDAILSPAHAYTHHHRRHHHMLSQGRSYSRV